MDILISGPKVLLRDRLPADADRYVYWMGHGEWRDLDAPWEDTCDPSTPQGRAEIKQRFISKCVQELPCPRTYAVIAARDGRPLGWVSSYTKEDAPCTRFVGIDICEDDCLNRGLGTEALRLWIDYLAAHIDVLYIGLETWSFNPRMIRVAEKAGLVYYRTLVKEIEWQGQVHDLLQFRLLRSERQTAASRGRCE